MPRKSKTPTYISWQAAIQRCHNPMHSNYWKYGARGIKVWDRWRFSYERFLADMGERPPGTTLDRIDGTKGYEPGNCRWATGKEQHNNKKSNTVVTYDGETKTLTEWADKFGLAPGLVFTRYRRGWKAPKLFEKGRGYANYRN